MAIVVALFALAWIGRAAAAGPTGSMSPALAALGDADSGVADAAPVIALEFLADAAPALTPVAASALPTATAAHGRASATEPVFLNHASVEELRRLPGVGPKRAEAILVLRQRLGRFSRVEDLLRVKGVGRSTVKKWRPIVRLDAPPSPQDPADGGAP